MSGNRSLLVGGVLLLGVAIALAQQSGLTDEGGRVLGLENAWNHAVEAKDTSALDTLLASTMVAVDSDGSISTKSEFLASIKAPDYQPSQAVTEETSVHVYGDAAVVVGIFRSKGIDKKKAFARRERFVDTWVKTKGSWQCVSSVVVLMPARQAAD